MQGYFVKSTNVTPSIYFNPKINVLDIRGKSTPENPLTFYNHIYNSLDQYEQAGFSDISVNLAFEYFNTSSSKCLYLVFKKLDGMKAVGKAPVVNWYYETGDDDMLETGEDLMSFFNIDFNIIQIPEITALGGRKAKNESNVVN